MSSIAREDSPRRPRDARRAGERTLTIGNPRDTAPASLPASASDGGREALRWAASGAMALTGHASGPPRLAPGRVVTRADALLDALRADAPDPARLPADAGALLGERAAIAGLARHGRTSAGGRARLLRTGDGWLALQLARPDDVALLPAWLETDAERFRGDPWPAVAAAVADRSAAPLVARARSMGLPAAPLGAPSDGDVPPALRVTRPGTPRRRHDGPWRVIDLSSLWAGPLATHLLAALGARVVKVESCARADGARRGPAPFLDLLNADKESAALDFGTSEGREALRRLVAWADLVVESARPRALAQLGFDAGALLAEHPGLAWLSITGYGRPDPGGGWAAFGDDAAVAGALVARDEDGAPLFCGDAIADPLAGLHAAGAAARALRGGGGALVDVSLCGVAADAAAGAVDPRVSVVCDGDGHRVVHEGGTVAVAPPRARRAAGPARALGADTAAVLREVGR
ncbi:MAG TPA: CoA transferase [Myxococcota bacterium]|nr:CoA transferase [Myxococcota bacterium]